MPEQTETKQELLEPVFTEEMLQSLQQRNQKRLEEVKARMQEKWLLHPNNKINKKQLVNHA